MRRRTIALLALLCIAGCSRFGCGTVPPRPPDPGEDEPAVTTTNGLEGAEQQRWHHLAEGSELYPLAWLLALENADTGKPFLDNPQRFGLLPDTVHAEENPYGLPVGVTADYTRDLRFAGVQMIGVNCAGCHVNELHYKGQPVLRIDGAPNLFDLELFLRELALATRATFTDAGKAWRFARRLYDVYHPAEGKARVTRAARPSDDVFQSYETLAGMREKGEFGKRLAGQIEAVHAAELKRPAVDLNKGLVVRPNGPALRTYSEDVRRKGSRRVEQTAELQSAARALRVKSFGALPAPNVSPVVGAAPHASTRLAKLDIAARTLSVSDGIAHFAETVRLLKARAEFLLSLAGSSGLAHTDPGFGRVDAFGSARNRFFPEAVMPTTSPVSYPHLWGLNQLNWLHWDANTTSITERNAGQAIGLGAVFDPDTFESTLQAENQKELEGLARKILPPRWPEKAFGAIDAEKARRGTALFENRCATCHRAPAPGEKVADRRFALDKIGTDPRRAESFGVAVGAEPFNEALSRSLKRLVRKAGGQTPDENLWRVTGQYAARPLTSIWATAPYLHNNSVPTLYDLLLPASERPKAFPVGHREYDPVRLGYAKEKGTPSFPFDTAKPGNSNAGHDSPEYGTDMTEPQRMDLLEYLKGL